MFHSAANPIIRLVFVPVLLLFYLQYSGSPLPILAPMFVVIFLTLMPSRPPINMMLSLLVNLLFISFVLVFFAGVLVDSPTGFHFYCWSILFWSYYRSHRNPKDILSTLMLLVIIIVTIASKQNHISVDGLPWLMFEQLLLAIIVTSLSFVIFPGEQQDILPNQPKPKDLQVKIGVVVFKATAMWLVIVSLIAIGGSQSMLIAMTISSLIKIPTEEGHQEFKYNRLVTTSIGILFTLPIMLLYAFGVPTWVLIGVSLFCGIQLACYAIRRNSHFALYQLMFTNFTVLIYQIIKHQGAASIPAEFLRLFSIVVGILIGVVIINLVASKIEQVESV